MLHTAVLEVWDYSTKAWTLSGTDTGRHHLPRSLPPVMGFGLSAPGCVQGVGIITGAGTVAMGVGDLEACMNAIGTAELVQFVVPERSFACYLLQVAMYKVCQIKIDPTSSMRIYLDLLITDRALASTMMQFVATCW